MDEVGLTGPPRERLDHFFLDTCTALVNHDGTADGTPPTFVQRAKRP